jgi:hydrophobic/amphiphilic exporter-1 (mainly G- bacteria), HAE1 family
MAVNVSAFSIRKPIPALVLFGVLMLMGLFSFMQLPITRFPNIDVPVISVTVTQPGAAPAELETQVSKRVEDAVSGITGVKNITSTLTDGSSTTAVEFRLEIDTDRALNDVKDAIAKIRPDLPRNVDEPIINRVDIEGQSILTYAVSAPAKTLEQLSWFVDDTVKRNVQGAKGVGKVERIGGVAREIRVTLNPDQLMSLGITAADVNRQLKATNADLAGGRGEFGGQEQTIRTLAGSRTVESLGDTKIVLPGGREVRLSDLGTVVDSFEEQRSFARLNAETPVVSIAIYRAKGASDYDVKNAVQKRMDELAARDASVSYSLIDDSVSYTYGNYVSAMSSLIEGAVLAVIVVFIFLKDWRATLISAIALPLSVIPTFWAIDAMGFSLNLVSLLAITLVTGVLVDDAIVEIENIVRHIRMGKSPYRAAMEAADEIGLAVIAITFTIVAIFAPVSFMGGIPGQYFKQFGLVVAAAVLFSLLVARLITPMMAAYFMKPHAAQEAEDGWLMRHYLAFLHKTLAIRPTLVPVPSLTALRRREKVQFRPRLFNVHMPYVTVLVGFIIFYGTITAAGLLPQGFIPAEDASRFVLSVELPPGETLEDTQRKTDQVVKKLREQPEIANVLVFGGTSPTGTREIRRATLIVKLTPKKSRSRSQYILEAEAIKIASSVPDIRAWKLNDRGDRELSISFVSNDPEALSRAVAEIEGQMRRVPGFTNVAAVAGLERPELRVTPRSDEAARFGVTTDQISEAVRVATIGDVGPQLAKFNAGDRLIPIRVQMDEMARGDIERISAMSVNSSTGAAVPLNAVADIDFGQGPSSIDRFNRERRVIIGTDLIKITTGQGLDIINELPAVKNLPAGVRLQVTGDAEIQADVFAGFTKAMGLGLVIVFGVLVLLFASVFQPITIMLSLPLSIGGVIVALLATNNPVSMPVVIGILMLFGIVTKNAIMLVDFAVEEEAKGIPRDEAIVDAGRKRARPIVMTTIAMVAGMIPSAIAFGEGGEFRAPMAIAVIGGLLVSTVLSLVFVPSFYTVMDDISRLVGRFFQRFVGPSEDESTWKPIPPIQNHALSPAAAPSSRMAAE